MCTENWQCQRICSNKNQANLYFYKKLWKSHRIPNKTKTLIKKSSISHNMRKALYFIKSYFISFVASADISYLRWHKSSLVNKLWIKNNNISLVFVVTPFHTPDDALLKYFALLNFSTLYDISLLSYEF